MVNDLDYGVIEFPVSKKDSKTRKIIFPLMCFVMTIDWFILFIYQIRSLKFVWSYYWLVTKIIHIMSTSKTLADLCAVKQSAEIKNAFVDIVCNVLVVKRFWQSIKKFV